VVCGEIQPVEGEGEVADDGMVELLDAAQAALRKPSTKRKASPRV